MAVLSYKCPNCGGELIFDPASQQFKCEYCITNYTQAEIEALNPDTSSEDKIVEEQDDGTKEEVVLYTCPSCGAEIVTDSTTAATFCYYCHNPVVLSGRISGEFLPDSVIPFVLDKEVATNKFMEFVHKKKFIPTNFFNRNQIEKISGVYFPYWLYDCEMESDISATGTNVRHWRQGDMQYTERKTYRIERSGGIRLKNIYKNALRKSNRKLAEGVFPYDMSAEKEFHMGYLSGFLAEKRDIEKENLEAEVREDAKEYSKDILMDTIDGYSSVVPNSEHHNIISEKWRYTMLPVWTVTYPGKDGKTYFYSMNGQTGSVVGELPVDNKKVYTFGAIMGVITFVITMLGGLLIW